MKKIVFGLIATVMFGYNSNAQSVIKYSDYGFYHNEALNEFIKKHGDNQKNIDFILDEGLKIMIEKYPNLYKDVKTSNIKEVFGVKTSNEFVFLNIWNKNKSNLHKNQNVSLKIIDLIDEIVNKNYEYNEINNLIANFEKSNKLTQEEENSITIIKSVLNASNEFWSNYYKSNDTTKRRHRPGSATLIADFAGAGMFMFTGPVAAFAGFACSYLTHQNDR